MIRGFEGLLVHNYNRYSKTKHFSKFLNSPNLHSVLRVHTIYHFANLKSNIINNEFRLKFNNIFIADLDARLR